MRKLLTLFVLICVLNVLTLGGLVGFLASTGRLDRTKVQAISDLLRHRGTPDKLRESLYDLMEPATAPATAQAAASRPTLALGTPAALGPATSEERLDYVNQALERARLKLESEAQAVREARNSLENLRDDVSRDMAKFAAEKKSFEAERARVAATSNDGSLTKTLALYDEMKPKQIKDIFMNLPAEEAARYVDAMAPDRAARIFAEFKSADEKTRLNALLEQVRTAGTGAASATQPAGALPAAPSPAAAATPSGQAALSTAATPGG